MGVEKTPLGEVRPRADRVPRGHRSHVIEPVRSILNRDTTLPMGLAIGAERPFRHHPVSVPASSTPLRPSKVIPASICSDDERIRRRARIKWKERRVPRQYGYEVEHEQTGDVSMSIRVSGAALGEIQKLFGWGAMGAWTDSQLVEQFLAGEAASEAAFRVLIHRHGPMVLAVCRRILGDEHAAEDAFQATFLVFVKKAGRLRDLGLLTNWLYGVALKVSHKERARGARRRVVERQAAEQAPRATVGPEPGELRSVIDEEIRRLPERYRVPLVLCHVEGLRHDEVAQRLGCPVGTVESRLSRAREQLRTRLARRGLAPSASAMAAVLRPPGVGLVPPSLVESTLRGDDESGPDVRRPFRWPCPAGLLVRVRTGRGRGGALHGDRGGRPGNVPCGEPRYAGRCRLANRAAVAGASPHAAGHRPTDVEHHDRRAARRLARRAAEISDPEPVHQPAEGLPRHRRRTARHRGRIHGRL